MKPNISEFSYGYALTDELIHGQGMAITGAPVFPSLYDEGQPGGGWDLRLDRPGVPLFIQFKLADFMKRRTCKESTNPGLTVPCYRMHLRAKRFSRQHELLLDLEQKGHEVYYSAPGFHEPHELNDAYLNQHVKVRSLWLKPSQIGPLPDDKDHHVSFTLGGAWFLYSREPRRIEGRGDFPAFVEALRAVLYERGDAPVSLGLEKLAEDIAMTAERRPDISSREKEETRVRLIDAAPIKRAAYYASVYLESQLFIAHTWTPAA